MVAVAVTLLAGCSVAESLPLPDCQGGGTVLIVAQSVPNAELVPCLGQVDPRVPQPDSAGSGGGSLPAGWERATVTVDQDGSIIHLDSDRAGVDAAVFHYEEACDTAEAVSVPSDQEGAAAFESIEQIAPGLRAARYYVFPGGCAWWEFDFDEGAPAALAIELQSRLFLVPRQFLNDSISETFVDEEL